MKLNVLEVFNINFLFFWSLYTLLTLKSFELLPIYAVGCIFVSLSLHRLILSFSLQLFIGRI